MSSCANPIVRQGQVRNVGLAGHEPIVLWQALVDKHDRFSGRRVAVSSGLEEIILRWARTGEEAAHA